MGVTLSDLVERFDSGEIRLPLMQREYVWRPKKVVRLLDSLYRRWPIGSFYVWQTTSDRPTRPRAGKTQQARHLDSFFGFLLDGQQRLTSLSLGLTSDADGELSHRAFFDIENEQFYLGEMNKTIAKRIYSGDPLLVPLSEIVMIGRDNDIELHKSIERVMQGLREQSKLGKNGNMEVHYRGRLDRLARILRRDALCEEFPDEEEEHAFELFSRLNKGGTSLSAGDVEAARLASAATRGIVEPMRALAAEREMRMLGINFVFLLRALVTVHRGNSSFSKLPRSWADDKAEVEASWKRTEHALRTTVKFARVHVGWTTRRWLPSTMALIPVIYLLAKSGGGDLKANDARYVKRYLLISGLRGLFRGASETTINTFVNAVRDVKGDRSRLARTLFERIPKNRLFRIRKDDVRTTTGMYSPLMQIYLAYLYSVDAKSWLSCRSLRDIIHEGLPGDPLAVHHIFPKQFMAGIDIPLERANIVPNYAVLSQPDNASIGDVQPLDMWKSLKQNQKECASAQLFFEASDNLLKPGAYEEFIDFRADKIAQHLNEFLGLA
jgi:hypothetical protein